MTYPITEIDGIDVEAAATLKSAGIRSTERLLEEARTLRGRKRLALKTGLDEKQLLCWANIADRMRVKGIRKEYAGLLQAAGVDTVQGTQIPQSGKPRQGDGRGQPQAQAGRSFCRPPRWWGAGSSTPRSCSSRSRISELPVPRFRRARCNGAA